MTDTPAFPYRTLLYEIDAGHRLEKVSVDLRFLAGDLQIADEEDNIATEQHPKTSNIFLINFQNRISQPIFSEIHPWASFSHMIITSSGIQGLLEQRNPRFMP